MSVFSGLVGFVLGGIVGWFARLFITDPIAEFRRLRSDGYRAFLTHLATKPLPEGQGPASQRDANRKKLSEARQELAQCGRALSTFKANNVVLSRMLSFLGCDIDAAANALTGFAAHIEQHNVAADAYFDAYKSGLKLPGSSNRHEFAPPQ